jgi:pimeloyl-ACP methyl ester carboxylesterase
VIKMFATSNLENFSGALQRSKDIAAQIPGEGIIAVLNGMMIRPSRVSLMEAGSVPCLWILGLMDNYIPCDVVQAKVNLPSNARVVVLSNSGHMGFIEEEELSVKIIRDFVNSLV